MRSNCVQVMLFQIVSISLCLSSFAAAPQQAQKPDIANLSQEFIDPKSIAPWIFTPQENIKRVDTDEHPGYVTIWEAGKGQDIKGILKDPIKIDDYRLPWEFHLGMVQNAQAQKGISEKQINYAIGLNLALTFSDPSPGPKNRSNRPSPGVFLVYGRGDLAPNAVGNWDMPYSWVGPEPVPGQIESGSWSKEGGPSSTPGGFRAGWVSPT